MNQVRDEGNCGEVTNRGEEAQHFDHLISEYVDYYHIERPHQSLENKPLVGHWPEPGRKPPSDGEIVCRSRLGGWLKSYERKVA